MMMDKVNVMYLVDPVIVDMMDTIHMADMILVKKKIMPKNYNTKLFATKMHTCFEIGSNKLGNGHICTLSA